MLPPCSLSAAIGQSQRRCATGTQCGTQCTDQAAVLNVVTIQEISLLIPINSHRQVSQLCNGSSWLAGSSSAFGLMKYPTRRLFFFFFSIHAMIHAITLIK